MKQMPNFDPWWWQAPTPSSIQSSALPSEVDIAIVGSGYTGLSAALTLARSGKSVLILEAEMAGYGASTRNGGQVGSGNQKFKVQALVDLFGTDKAKALLNAGNEMLGYIETLIRDENIDCQFAKVGRFRGAIQASHYEVMAKDMQDLNRFAGVEYAMIPKAEQHQEVATDLYFGGALLPNDAALHPGLYYRGLLDRVINSGVVLCEQIRVVDVQKNAVGFEINCQKTESNTPKQASLKAGQVLIATNGYSNVNLADLKPRIVPIGTSIIATEELDKSLISRLMPKGRVYGNSARVFHYYRPTPDGKRMLFGGRVGRTAKENSFRAYAHLQSEMCTLFPTLTGTQITHCWTGKIAYTNDTFPHLGQKQGLWYAAGYCGTGISRSTWFGHKVALKMLENGKSDQEAKTPFDDLDFSAFQNHWAAPIGVVAVESWYRILDKLNK